MSTTKYAAQHVRPDAVDIDDAFQPPRRYEVPPYQRRFVWGPEQREEFIEDFRTTGANEVLYLGEQLLVDRGTDADGTEVTEISDGQQRMASFQLLLGAIQRKASAMGKATIESEIDGYLASNGGPSLTLGALDDAAFHDIVAQGHSAAAHQQLAEAAAHFERFVDEAVDTPADLEALFDKLRYQVVFIQVHTDGMNPHTLYEGKNGRGTAMSPVDRIHNHAMEVANDTGSINAAAVNDAWNDIEAALEDTNRERFFRQYAMAAPWPKICTKVTKSTLFDIYAANIELVCRSPRDDLQSYIERIAAAAKLYATITDHAVTVYSSVANAEINRHLRNIDTIGATPSRILTLRALIANASPSTLIDLLVAMEKFSFQRRTVGQSASPEPKIYNGLAHTVFDPVTPSTSPVSDVRSRLRDDLPSELAFKTEFARTEFDRGKRTKYVLDTIECEHFSPASPGFGGDTDAVVGHIAPRKLFEYAKYANWRPYLNSSDEEFELVRDHIGNLVLVDDRATVKATQTPFQQKCSEYASSDYRLTEVVTTYSQWSLDTIEARSAALADIAADVWAL